jgi:hypothetical protein
MLQLPAAAAPMSYDCFAQLRNTGMTRKLSSGGSKYIIRPVEFLNPFSTPRRAYQLPYP